MTGPKLNEKSFVAGERAGTKATARYVRTSASKACAVLDLIRGLDVRSADEVLAFTDRHVARDVRKVLASAVANAVNNDDQDADELFVIACFADEGPTLRRFRPRARGRATRINKRSCHITVIVARMSDERIEILTARQERAGGSTGRGRPQSSSASRRQRVERSRQQAAGAETPSMPSTPTRRSSTPRSSTTRLSRRPLTSRTPSTSPRASPPTPRRRPTSPQTLPKPKRPKPTTTTQRPPTKPQTPPPAPREAPATRRSPMRRTSGPTKRTPNNGSEDQSVRLPSGSDHRLEVALVLGARVQGLPHRGLDDPSGDYVPSRVGCDQPYRGRAHP